MWRSVHLLGLDGYSTAPFGFPYCHTAEDTVDEFKFVRTALSSVDYKSGGPFVIRFAAQSDDFEFDNDWL